MPDAAPEVLSAEEFERAWSERNQPVAAVEPAPHSVTLHIDPAVGALVLVGIAALFLRRSPAAAPAPGVKKNAKVANATSHAKYRLGKPRKYARGESVTLRVFKR